MKDVFWTALILDVNGWLGVLSPLLTQLKFENKIPKPKGIVN